MSKLLKSVFILAIALITIFNCSYVFAAVDMNLNNTNTSSNTSNTNSTNNTSTTNTNKVSNSSNSSQFSTAVSTSGFDLQLTNILSICLIVVGVLLILLGIAILIRLKK